MQIMLVTLSGKKYTVLIGLSTKVILFYYL